MSGAGATGASIRDRGAAWTRALALAALLCATALVYAPVRHHDFIDLDDPQYVADHARVQAGPTLENLAWAFTTPHAGNWFPLTWLSHMVDCAVFGVDPGAHHLVNLALHLANTALLTAVLLLMTGAFWRSLAVAALFALHPLHVESVAWIAERKDVLSTFFGLLALVAYARYAVRPSPGRLAGVALPFALSLMAKPMLVTLPVLMLLLDVWPLGRVAAAWAPASLAGVTTRRSPGILLVEKLPLLALSAASAAITLHAQHAGGALVSAQLLPLADRLGNAVVAYGTYLLRTFWPHPLAVYYPHPGAQPAAAILAFGALLVATTALSLWRWRRAPWALVGWAWFGVSLLPVIGIVQVGYQALADRYTYLPLVGIFVAVVWSLADRLGARRRGRAALVALALAALAACSFATHRQVERWRDTRTLFAHTLAVTGDNAMAHLALAQAEARGGDLARATGHLEEAVRIQPGLLAARYDLGVVLGRAGRLDEAIAQYERILVADPDHAETHAQLGLALAGRGRLDEAVEHYRAALRADPELVQARTNLGVALASRGEPQAAEQAHREALRREPDFVAARFNLAMALIDQGRTDEAAPELVRVLAQAPELLAARLHLAVLRANQGRGDEARALAEGVLERRAGEPRALQILDFLDRRSRGGEPGP